MVVKQHEFGVEELTAWYGTLVQQAEDLRDEISAREDELNHVEERLVLVTKLLEIETRNESDPTVQEKVEDVVVAQDDTKAGTNAVGVEEAVEEVLRAAGEPMHISAIRDALLNRRIRIPGRGDDANIIVRLRRREDRFTRTARGTYALSEWGLSTLPKKPQKRRRARK